MKIEIPEGVCDVHVHIGDFPSLEIKFTLRDLYAVVKRFGVSKILLSSSEANSDKYNERIIEEAKKNKGIYALMRPSLEKFSSEDFLHRLNDLLDEGVILGLKINPSKQKRRITDPIYEGALELLNNHQSILLVHCGRWVEMSGWQYALEIAKKYPEIKVIFAHMGGTHPSLSLSAIRSSKNVKNVYLETSQTRQLIVIRKAVMELGSRRVLFGTDMPWGDYLQNLVGILQSKLNEASLNNIFFNNFNSLIQNHS